MTIVLSRKSVVLGIIIWGIMSGSLGITLFTMPDEFISLLQELNPSIKVDV